MAGGQPVGGGVAPVPPPVIPQNVIGAPVPVVAQPAGPGPAGPVGPIVPPPQPGVGMLPAPGAMGGGPAGMPPVPDFQRLINEAIAGVNEENRQVVNTLLDVLKMQQPGGREIQRSQGAQPRMMTYDGSEQWAEFEAHVEQYSHYFGWSDTEKASNLCLSLRGRAQSVLVELTPIERTNFNKVIAKLAKHFAPPGKAFVYEAELQARRYVAGESLQDLGQEIRRKTRLGHPGVSEETRDALGKTAL